jgi:hypothetical protein
MSWIHQLLRVGSEHFPTLICKAEKESNNQRKANTIENIIDLGTKVEQLVSIRNTTVELEKIAILQTPIAVLQR